ncbi:MAG: hypothetical protein GXX99_08065 [Clostridiales bacterium]|nr:hypothetical protein [Clostridiales bacterium]
MWGLAIGLGCGLVELYLLHRLLRSLLDARTGAVAGLLLLKLAALACAFVPVIRFLRSELLWCGVGITAVLTGGSILLFIKNQYFERRP